MTVHGRTVPLEDTLRAVPLLRRRFGITRLADLTYLDRAGVPVFAAIAPLSRDPLSTYNGKGLTREHAIVSAIMEAVERQAAAEATLPEVLLRPGERPDALDPRELLLEPEWHERAIPFVSGTDVLAGSPYLVPLDAAVWPRRGPRRFGAVTTNGLAAGNTPLEAAYHAIVELVERHVWSLAHARAHVVPLRAVQAFAGSDRLAFDAMVDDPAGVTLAHPTGCSAIDGLVARIESAGLRLRMTVLREDPLPLVVVAAVWDPGAAKPAAHIGAGCSWSPAYAALRALTEAMQSRVADLSAGREDIRLAGEPLGRFGAHSRRIARLPSGRWFFDVANGTVRLDDLEDRTDADLRKNYERLLDALRGGGVRTCTIVDLSPADVPVYVVRAVAPDLESAIVDGRIGRSLARLFNNTL